MEAKGSAPYSQEPATGPYPQSDAPSQRLPILFPKTHSNINLASTPRSSE
jgi:hypothetical protein